jgi:predicted enzyme related to lactoylglutathione lyase
MLLTALAIVVASCTTSNNPETNAAQADTITTKTSTDMKNLVSIIEIPTVDFVRAVKFYQLILDVKIEEVEMGPVRMGLFPGSENTVNVALVNGADYKPSIDGTTIYLHVGDDLQATLDKALSNGGKALVPKTEISPEMGFFAMFVDSEGNKVGLHSTH